MKIELNTDLKKLTDEYRKKSHPILFDFKRASRPLLDNQSIRDNRYFHYIHYYPGRIYPYIPLFILSLKDLVNLGGYVLDPFAGSGTILLESIINPVLKRNALGVEINPIARLISKVKITPININEIDQVMNRLRKIYFSKSNKSSFVPEFKNIHFWFSEDAINKLSNLKYSIERLDIARDYMDFFWVCFSSVIRKVSKADPYIPPPVILKPEKYKNSQLRYQKLINHLTRTENPELWNLFEDTVNSIKGKICYLNNFKELKNNEIRGEMIWDDAREIKMGKLSDYGRINNGRMERMSSNNIDIIFTSPPYLTAQKYIRTNRLELYWLGYSKKEIHDLEFSSIGTETTSLKRDFVELGLTPIDSLIKNTLSKSKERGEMVYNYFENMLKVFKEIYRILKRKGYAIIVVGSNKVLGKKVDTHRLLTDEAKSVGFNEIVILKDEIKTRSMLTKRNGTGGLIKEEYIIIFRKG